MRANFVTVIPEHSELLVALPEEGIEATGFEESPEPELHEETSLAEVLPPLDIATILDNEVPHENSTDEGKFF